MVLKERAQAGSLESSDCLVSVEPAGEGRGLQLSVRSIVMNQFGEAIREVARETLEAAGVRDALVDINDRGALDFVIRARLRTALERAGMKEPIP